MDELSPWMEVTSKTALDDLIAASSASGKKLVLEVRREKSPASEVRARFSANGGRRLLLRVLRYEYSLCFCLQGFAPKFSSLAADFADTTVFAK